MSSLPAILRRRSARAVLAGGFMVFMTMSQAAAGAGHVRPVALSSVTCSLAPARRVFLTDDVGSHDYLHHQPEAIVLRKVTTSTRSSIYVPTFRPVDQ
jgi:hypothetical protein